ncbi:DUF4097 domain-containing protein [Staphylococcus sp. SQ8-PEA]|uniref:DUF4097 domain-containing protein n=1 Tax=Staphylococcus marylandisciuri TaxID=2981529 RepID=A0ABT2QQB3_9STAP|nr:DUF4097 domain-containing protein [Staphylococcus marylandisciuri]MCU5746182.1 DUF4097 domain-containing protein [Staphylococcus marylandisciuri]
MKKFFIVGFILFTICFVAATLTWFNVDKTHFKENKYHKPLDSHISKLSINLKDDIHTTTIIKEGKHFSIDYQGRRYVDVTKEKSEVSVKEKVNRKDTYGMNFNPFKRNDNCLVVTIPKQVNSNLEISNISGKIHFKNVHLNKVKLIPNTKAITYLAIDSSIINELRYSNEISNVNIQNSRILGGRIKVDSGEFNLEDTLLKNVALINHKDDITLKNMQPICNFKASSDESDININYRSKPKNVALKLNPVYGKEHITNPNFKDYRIGNGKNQIELYTYYGDINVK